MSTQTPIEFQDDRAIENGRGAGAAIEAASIARAKELWAKVPQLVGMPDIEDLHQAFTTRDPENFSRWANKAVFTSGESTFACFCGSIARGLVYKSNEVTVPVDSDAKPRWAYDHAIHGLRMAGFEEPAKSLEEMIIKEVAKVPDSNTVELNKSKKPLTGKDSSKKL